MSKTNILHSLAIVGWLLTSPNAVAAGEFTVEPFRLEMGPRQKSGMFTVTNVGSGQLNFQIRLSEWTQDREGKDVYSDTTDIVFYPKILSLKAGERQIIRVGASKPIVASEKSYRLFIDEMPSPPPAEKQRAAQVSVRVSFAPPIFVRPLKELEQGAIEKITLEKRNIKVAIRNPGNVHLRANSGEGPGGREGCGSDDGVAGDHDSGPSALCRLPRRGNFRNSPACAGCGSLRAWP